ncbi:MAG TPA: Rne/Rng family ribonuclease [Thermoanaerobaculia bacterium]|nr:Rne/Rng family ribonuclease [Thermoanaerobaculia bacterium]
MLVESDPHQTAIAVLENDRLTEIYVERHRHRSIVGNLYKGRVTRVLPGMQAAFVDIGLERDAFLYVSDVADEVLSAGREEMAFDLDEPANGSLSSAPMPSIDELLKQGQELLVQVIKAPLPSKGARITSQVTLPGRYLVLLPTVRHVGVSRRIEDDAERARLLELVSEIAPAGFGLIVRTVGEGKGRAEFEADLAYLTRLWQQVRERTGRAGAPTLVHRDLDLALRVVRDVFSPDVSVLVVEGEEAYTRIVDFLDQVQPSLVPRVKLHGSDGALFDRFGINEEMEAALKSKVWLKSGGYIVINQTEALVAIDVNTGRYTGERNLEDTVLKTNLEAVAEVVRQVRLRDLGGIIVVDFIDMTQEEHRQQVFRALEAELHKDRARTKVLSISEFGLVEITRKRSRANLERLLTQACPYCGGTGRIKSVSTICLSIRREVLRSRDEPHAREILLRVHPEVARALQQEERPILEELERALGVAVLLHSDSELHQERFHIEEV